MSRCLGFVSTRLTRFLLAAVTVAALGVTVAGTASAQSGPTVMLVPNPDLGMVLTDPAGFSLYTWDGDSPGMSACFDACSEAWPPYLAFSDLIAPPGLPGILSYIDRGDGTWQVASPRSM